MFCKIKGNRRNYIIQTILIFWLNGGSDSEEPYEIVRSKSISGYFVLNTQLKLRVDLKIYESNGLHKKPSNQNIHVIVWIIRNHTIILSISFDLQNIYTVNPYGCCLSFWKIPVTFSVFCWSLWFVVSSAGMKKFILFSPIFTSAFFITKNNFTYFVPKSRFPTFKSTDTSRIWIRDYNFTYFKHNNPLNLAFIIFLARLFVCL